MNRKTTIAFGFIAATALAFPAFAQGQQQHHGQKGQGAGVMGNQAGGGMGAGMGEGMAEGMGNHKQMRQMMMRMHSQMMAGGQGQMMGGMGKAGSGPAGGMMGGMKMPMMDTDKDGTITAEEARAALTAKLKEFDADGNGTLSIAEFETLHSANIREQMVDRFQGFDNDGDGQVTLEEMTAPASRMERMQAMKERAGDMGQNMQGMGSMDGPMDGEMPTGN